MTLMVLLFSKSSEYFVTPAWSDSTPNILIKPLIHRIAAVIEEAVVVVGLGLVEVELHSPAN